MKPETILTSFSAIAFVFTVCALVGANLWQRADTPRVEPGALASLDDKDHISGEHISQKRDRLFHGNEYTKFEMAPPTDLMVDGVAPGDLLNVRVLPSPGASVVARLDNGAVVKKLGCRDIAGYRWCLVEPIENKRLTGWAAARYLKMLSEQPTDH